MPNFRTHFFVGGCASALTYAIRKKSRNEEIGALELVGMFLIGGGAASIPDAIDTPNGPNHRSIAHSWAAIGGIGNISNSLNDNPNLTVAQKDLAYSVMVAYLSHLFLDAQTPKGLPLFTNH